MHYHYPLILECHSLKDCLITVYSPMKLQEGIQYFTGRGSWYTG